MEITVKTESLPAEDVYRNLLRRFRTSVYADGEEIGIRHWEISILRMYDTEFKHHGERLVNSLVLVPDTTHVSAAHFKVAEAVRVRVYREWSGSWVWSGERNSDWLKYSWGVRHPYDTPEYAILRGMEWLVEQAEGAMRVAATAERHHADDDLVVDELVAHHQELMRGLQAVKTAKPGNALELEPAVIPVYNLEPAPAVEVTAWPN